MQEKLFILPAREPTEPGHTSTHNLPAQLTPLIGREQEVAASSTLLRRPEVRLLTFTGTGGIGKTSLALRVATDLLDDFPDGVCLVLLAPISDPDLVIPTIAQTLAIKEVAVQSPLASLRSHLQHKHLLLLLDNFEQVVVAAPVLTDLLESCPFLKLLVTSREVLRLRGEHEYPVPSLTVPELQQQASIKGLAQYAAVVLFLQRAQAVKPDFHLTDANASSIAAICTRLDGLPLALELAAARLKHLSVRAILARLEHRFQVLTHGPQDVHERQRTLRNTIQWSYDLLSVQEQRLFRRLSVFVGGCTLEAIEALYKMLDGESMYVFDGVTSLIDKSLLQQGKQDGEGGEEPRYLMLETIREYGLEALTNNGEVEPTRHAHAEYYLVLAEEAELRLRGSQQAIWFDRVEREHGNLRAVLNWLLERGEEKESIERTLRLCGALWWFWEDHFKREGQTFLEQALARSEGVAVALRAKALWAAGNLVGKLGDFDRGEALCKESLALFREIGNTAGVGTAVLHLGILSFYRGTFTEARSQLEESLALLEEAGDKTGTGWSLFFLANAEICQGEYTKGYSHVEESLALFRELRDKRAVIDSLVLLAEERLNSQGDATKARALLEEGLALSRELANTDTAKEGKLLGSLGEISLYQGNMALARSLLEESMTILQGEDMDELINKAWLLSQLAKIAAVQHDYTRARTLYEQSLAINREVFFRVNTPFYLEGLASVVAAQGEPTWAAQLWGAAEALRDTMGAPIPPVYRVDYERAVTSARDQLGDRAFATTWAEGRAMTPDQALAAKGQTMLPQQVPTEPSSPQPAKSAITYPDGLTTREVEVLRLVAQGLTDAHIAEHLIISPRTVNTHLTSIYSKIQVSSRSGATRYAIEHKLV